MYIKKEKTNRKKGFTIIEALVFLFIFTITTLAFYQAFALGTIYILESKNRLGATQVGNEKLEIIRSLEYSKIGTKISNGSGGWIYGIPKGDLLQEEEVSKNTRLYFVKTSVKYVDDPFDGLASGAPADTRPADYKVVEVQVSWDPSFAENKTVNFVSTFVPQGVEAMASGGILSVNVQDNSGVPISIASVHLLNTKTSVDQTNPTENGNTMFFEVPQDLTSSYQIFVSKAGYYPVRTYPAYNPLVFGSFDPVYKNISITNGTLWQLAMTTDKLSELSILTKDMLGNDVPNVGFSLEGGMKIGTDKITTKSIWSYKENLNSGVDSKVEAVSADGISSGTYMVSITTTPTDYKFVKMSSATNLNTNFYLNPGITLNESALFVDTKINSLLATVVNTANGLPVVGASVKLKNEILDYEVTLVTDASGMVYFPTTLPELNKDEYEISITAAGFTNYSENISIDKLVEKTFQIN